MAEFQVPAPMVIGSRLMAAYVVKGVGTIHVEPLGRDSEDRVTYHYIVEDASGNVLCDAQDLWSGAGNDVMVLDTVDNLLGFMLAAGDAYSHEMKHGPGSSENGKLFPPAMMEWCYVNSEELSMAQFELTFDGSEG